MRCLGTDTEGLLDLMRMAMLGGGIGGGLLLGAILQYLLGGGLDWRRR